MNIIQDGLMYMACFFLLLATRRGYLGASRMRRFEQKHWAMLRLTSILVYINLGVALVTTFQQVVGGGDPNLFFKGEVLVLLFVAVWISVGMGKIRTTLTHGKKFTALLAYCGIALILIVMWLCYVKLWKFGGIVF